MSLADIIEKPNTEVINEFYRSSSGQVSELLKDIFEIDLIHQNPSEDELTLAMNDSNKEFKVTQDAFDEITACLTEMNLRIDNKTSSKQIFKRNSAWLRLGYAYDYIQGDGDRKQKAFTFYKTLNRNADTLRKTVKSGGRIVELAKILKIPLILKMRVSMRKVADTSDENWKKKLDLFKKLHAKIENVEVERLDGQD